MPGDRFSFRRGPMVDRPLLLGVVAILTLGLVNLYSATSVYIDDASRARLADIYVTQIYWIVVGAMIAILVAAIDYRHYERLAPVLYAGGMVSLGLVFVLGKDIRGSSRWIQLGQLRLPAQRIHEDLPDLDGRQGGPQRFPNRAQNAGRSGARRGLDLGAGRAGDGAARSRHVADLPAHVRVDAGHDAHPHVQRALAVGDRRGVDAARLDVRDARLPEAPHHQLPESRSGQDRHRLARAPVPDRDRQRSADGRGVHAGHAEPVRLLARAILRLPVRRVLRRLGLFRLAWC